MSGGAGLGYRQDGPGGSTRPAIVVTVDEQRLVTRVVVAVDWRDRIGPAALGECLTEAANEAILDEVARAAEALEPPTRPAPVHRDDAPSANGDPTGPVAQALVAEAMELFARFDTELVEYTQQLRDASTAPSQGVSGNGHVRVVLAAGQVSRVEVNPRWAARAGHAMVAAEALAAFEAAQHAMADDAVVVRMPPALARLVELAGDPHALSRQLGLSR